MTAAMLTTLRQRLYNVATGDGLKARLIRGGLGSAGIQAANRVLTLALGIVLGRALGAEGYGVYAYVFAVMSLLMVLAEAGVPTLLMREVAARHGREEWGLLRGALRRGAQFVLLAATGVSVLGLLVLWWGAHALTPEALYTTTVMLLALPFSALCKTVAFALRGLHWIVVGQAVDMLLRSSFVLALAGSAFLWWPALREPQYAMTAQIIGTAVVLGTGAVTLRYLLPSAAKCAKPEYRSREWFRSALPFALIGGTGILNSHTDIIMLGWLTGPKEVGIYRVAVQGAALVAIVLQVANAVMSPHFARLHSRGELIELQWLVERSSQAIFFLTLPIAGLLAFYGGDLAALLFGSEFRETHRPLAILAVGELAGASMGPLGFLLYMTGHQTSMLRVLALSACLNIGANALLIPNLGTSGAAMATALGQVLRVVVIYLIVRFTLKINPFPARK